MVKVRQKFVLLTLFTIGAVCFLSVTYIARSYSTWNKNQIYAAKLENPNDDHGAVENKTTIATTTTSTPSIPWIDEAESMRLLDENKLRCRATYIGCFVTIKDMMKVNGTFKEFKLNQGGDFKERCLHECFSNGKHLAGYNIRRLSCVCSATFEKFVSFKLKGKLASASLDLGAECRNNISYKVYSKIRDCKKGLTESAMKEDLIGCIDIPKQLGGIMTALKSPKLTSQQCLLNCEQRQFTIAIPVLKHNICVCSDSYSLFHNADNKKRMMRVCDNQEDQTVVPIYKTVVNDRHCQIKFFEKDYAPAIVLASNPGSGNTWIRHLIEITTGVYTGSVYTDGKLYEGGMLGELEPFNSGRTIAVKDHLAKSQINPYKMAILLIRNPYDAALAEWSRRETNSHTGVPSVENFKNPEFRKFAQGRPNGWSYIVKRVLKTFDEVLVVYYEDLKEDAVKQMRRVADFLPDDIVSSDGPKLERRLMCMDLDVEGNFKRPPKKLDCDPFHESERKLYDKAIHEIENLLIEYRQPPLNYKYFLPSKRPQTQCIYNATTTPGGEKKETSK